MAFPQVQIVLGMRLHRLNLLYLSRINFPRCYGSKGFLVSPKIALGHLLAAQRHIGLPINNYTIHWGGSGISKMAGKDRCFRVLDSGEGIKPKLEKTVSESLYSG